MPQGAKSGKKWERATLFLAMNHETDRAVWAGSLSWWTSQFPFCYLSRCFPLDAIANLCNPVDWQFDIWGWIWCTTPLRSYKTIKMLLTYAWTSLLTAEISNVMTLLPFVNKTHTPEFHHLCLWQGMSSWTCWKSQHTQRHFSFCTLLKYMKPILQWCFVCSDNLIKFVDTFHTKN
jgi:hypothetical protein